MYKGFINGQMCWKGRRKRNTGLKFKTFAEEEGHFLLLLRYWLKNEYLFGQDKEVICASEETLCHKDDKAGAKEVWQV